VAVQADASVGEFAARAAVEKKEALRRMASGAMRASLREWNNAGLLKLKLKTKAENWLEEDAIVA
jgi:hypothetical protein